MAGKAGTRGPLAFLWARHRVALLIFVGALLVALFFAVRFAAFWVYWSDPDRRDAAIEGWMTPGYVARSYQVDPEVLRDVLGVSPKDGRHRSLKDIAAETGLSVEEVVSALITAIEQERASDD